MLSNEEMTSMLGPPSFLKTLSGDSLFALFIMRSWLCSILHHSAFDFFEPRNCTGSNHLGKEP